MNNELDKLSEIILISTGKKARFTRLSPDNQYKVLKYIQKNSIDIKIHTKKWFDILSQKFYCLDKKLDSEFDFDSEIVSFDGFESFFEYVDGDIYCDSCFFGLELSDGLKNKYSIKTNKLNFESFEQATIDDIIPPSPIAKEKRITKKYYFDNNFYVEVEWLNIAKQTVDNQTLKFSYFFDFVHFLKNDLSKADLLLCDGVQNLTSLNDIDLSDIKVTSEVANLFGMQINQPPFSLKEINSFQPTIRNEDETIDTFLKLRDDEENKAIRTVSYLSDLHLIHRCIANKCVSKNDCELTVKKAALRIAENATRINILAGDISSDKGLFSLFIKSLKNYLGCLRPESRRYPRFYGYGVKQQFFITLGNHELWPFKELPLTAIILKYKNFLLANGMLLLHNNLYYEKNHEIHEITESKLLG